MLVRKHLLWYQERCAHGPPVDAEKFSETELSNGPFFKGSFGISRNLLKQERLFFTRQLTSSFSANASAGYQVFRPKNGSSSLCGN